MLASLTGSGFRGTIDRQTESDFYKIWGVAPDFVSNLRGGGRGERRAHEHGNKRETSQKPTHSPNAQGKERQPDRANSAEQPKQQLYKIPLGKSRPRKTTDKWEKTAKGRLITRSVIIPNMAILFNCHGNGCKAVSDGAHSQNRERPQADDGRTKGGDRASQRKRKAQRRVAARCAVTVGLYARIAAGRKTREGPRTNHNVGWWFGGGWAGLFLRFAGGFDRKRGSRHALSSLS